MRTTIDLSDDVLQAARELAKLKHQTLGSIVSELVRKGLTQDPNIEGSGEEVIYRNGVPLLPKRRGEVITADKVDALDRETLG